MKKLLDKVKKKIIELIFPREIEVVLNNIRIINLKVGEHTVRITKNAIEVDGKIIIETSAGKVYIKNLDGLQVPVGKDKYVP